MGTAVLGIVVVETVVVEAVVVEAVVVEDAVVEDAVVEDAVVEDAVVEDAVVEDAVVEDAVVDGPSVERYSPASPASWASARRPEYEGPTVDDSSKKLGEYMLLALREARRAIDAGDVPVGAVIVDEPTGRVIARAHNQRELLRDPTAHAEILAITQAAAYYGAWRLTQATLFVTLEPCIMCAGAIVLARIPRVYYAAQDPKAGAHCSVHRVLVHPANNHRPEVVAGLEKDASSALLQGFFRAKRAKPASREARLEGGMPRVPGIQDGVAPEGEDEGP